MDPIIFFHRGRYLPVFAFKPGVVPYDIEKALEGRYRNHQKKVKLIARVKSLVSLEWFLHHRYPSPLHPHANPVTVHIRKRR